jgi:phospholipid/cholesterol/gamma-HCH transport system substrate-binding protein
MAKSLTGARLGVFVFLGSVLLIIAVFLVGNKSSLFEKTYTIKTYFNNVEGLRTGALVRLSGLNIGSIKAITIAKGGSGKVEVEMDIKEDIKQLIRLDSKASIETEGLVGNKLIVISVGSEGFRVVENGGYIVSKDPVNMAQIIEEGKNTLNYVRDITKDFSEIVRRINNGQGTIGKLVNDETLYNSANQITQTADKSLVTITGRMDEVAGVITETTKDFKKIVTGLDGSIQKIDNLLFTVQEGKGVLGALVSEKSTYVDSINTVMRNFGQTALSIKSGAQKFAENMEALKHNWLFKSYFEERGYWDNGEYEKDLDKKLSDIKERTKVLEEKINMLRELEIKTRTGNK